MADLPLGEQGQLPWLSQRGVGYHSSAHVHFSRRGSSPLTMQSVFVEQVHSPGKKKEKDGPVRLDVVEFSELWKTYFLFFINQHITHMSL